MTVTESAITGNSSTSPAPQFAGIGGGGGIHSLRNVTVTDSTISGNTTAGIGGGGIYASRVVTLTRSVVSNNTVTGIGQGGGIKSSNSTLGGVILVDSTVSGNSLSAAGGRGGGIFANRSVSVTGSTVSDNEILSVTNFSTGGSGIFALGGVTLNHSTVTNNRAHGGTNGANGGGIWNEFSTNNIGILINNSIVAGNTTENIAIDAVQDIFDGSNLLTVRYSLIGDRRGETLIEAPIGMPDANGNLIGGPINGVINPLLGPLADNGGPTQTHALLPGSPAIDMGDPMFTPPPDYDQRGNPFGRLIDGDAVPVRGSTLGRSSCSRHRPPCRAITTWTTPSMPQITLCGVRRWRNSIPTYFGADGDGDGRVDDDDYGVWRSHFGQTLPPPGGSAVAGVYDPGSGVAATVDVIAHDAGLIEATNNTAGLIEATNNNAGLIEASYSSGVSAAARPTIPDVPAETRAQQGMNPIHPHPSPLPAGEGENRDDALVAWLASRGDDREGDSVETGPVTNDGTARDATDDAFDAFDAAFSTLVGAELR